MRKKIGHRDCSPWAYRKLTVSSLWPKWSQPAVTEPWPSRDHTEDAMIELWPRHDLAMTELWPRRDWAVASPRRDRAVIIGPRSRDHRGHRELRVSIYFLMGEFKLELQSGNS